MDQRWVVDISGGSVELGNFTPDREAFSHLGSPSGRAEPMPSWSKVCGDAAKGRQEPLSMPLGRAVSGARASNTDRRRASANCLGRVMAF